jgi:broad specificity phosphatase PhoE
MIIQLIRHAESEANKANLYGTDMSLTNKGILQSKNFKQDNTFKPQIVITSKKNRSIETANYIYGFNKIISMDLFNEIYFGKLEGTPIINFINNEIIKDPKLLKDKYCGDCIKFRAEKATEFIKTLPAQYNVKKISIISHGTLMENMLNIIVGNDIENHFWNNTWKMENCSQFILNVDDRKVLLVDYEKDVFS